MGGRTAARVKERKAALIKYLAPFDKMFIYMLMRTKYFCLITNPYLKIRSSLFLENILVKTQTKSKISPSKQSTPLSQGGKYFLSHFLLFSKLEKLRLTTFEKGPANLQSPLNPKPVGERESGNIMSICLRSLIILSICHLPCHTRLHK